MTFALIAHTSAGGSTTGFPNQATTSAINTTGANLIVVASADFDNGNESGVSDAQGNTFISTIFYNPANQTYLNFFYCLNPITSASHVFSTPGDGQGTVPSMAVAAFSGCNATPVDRQTTGSVATGTTIQPGSITPTQANELVISVMTQGFTATQSVSGSTSLENLIPSGTGPHIYQGIFMAYTIQTSATAINPTFTLGTSGDSSAYQISFFAAPTPSTGNFSAIYENSGTSVRWV